MADITGSGRPPETRAERRREPRYRAMGSAVMTFAKGVEVFGRLLNASANGACIEAPDQFAIDVGEQFRLRTPMHQGRPLFRVVGASGSRLHLMRVS